MFNKEFLVRLGKEALVVFILALCGAVLAGPGLGAAAAVAGLVAGARAIVGVVVRNVGEFENSPNL